MNIFDLSEKVAIVTGGNRGIGFSIARGLAQTGAFVIIANRNEKEGNKAAATLNKEGLKAAAIQVDITNVNSIATLIEKVKREYRNIDILVNNAAVIIRKQAEDFTEEDWDAMVNTNLKGTFFCCQFAASEMRKQKKGKIINISSVLSQMGQVGRSVYAVTKAGISHMTRTLGIEWIKYGINMNAIGPGVTLTELNKEFFKTNPDDYNKIISGVPIGRPGSPDDYVGAAIYLASEASEYMVGQTLIIDGGMVIL